MASYSLDEVNSMYVDVLKEIGNIGAGNATTAIASMLQLRIYDVDDKLNPLVRETVNNNTMIEQYF